MRVLAIVNQKGGVGKTTTAVTLAHGLALLGRRVLLVDLDAQGNCADALGMVKTDGVYRWLTSSDGQGAGTEACPYGGRPCVTASGRPGLSVVVGDKRTVEAREVLSGRMFRELAVREALEGIADGFEVAILDTAPGADLLQVGALVAADWFLVPVSLEHLAVVGAVDLLATAASLARSGAGGASFLGVLPTLWERTTREGQAQLEEIVGEFGQWVWPPIPVDVRCREAAAHGQTLWEWAGRCRALDGCVVAASGQRPAASEEGERVGGYREVLRRLGEVGGWG